MGAFATLVTTTKITMGYGTATTTAQIIQTAIRRTRMGTAWETSATTAQMTATLIKRTETRMELVMCATEVKTVTRTEYPTPWTTVQTNPTTTRMMQMGMAGEMFATMI